MLHSQSHSALYRTERYALRKPNLDASALADGLQIHVNQLIGAFDSYVDGDYAAAYNYARDAYAHMFMTAEALTGAIAKQFPERFPTIAEVQGPMIGLTLGSTALTVGSSKFTLDVAPFKKEDRVYVSLRTLSEIVGGEVKWEAATQTVTVTVGEHTAKFWIDSDQMEFDGMAKSIGAKVFIVKGRTQVPLEFITSLLGWDIQTDTKGGLWLSKSMR
jgi:hypothetical protein